MTRCRNFGAVPSRSAKWYLVFGVFLAGVLFLGPAAALALTVTVQGSDGAAISNYRWLLEEDLTFHPDLPPPTPPSPDFTVLGMNFHRSYMPPVAKGTAGQPLPALDPNKYYFLSVLPSAGPDPDTGEGYTLGGAAILPGQASVTVTLNKLPLPTAQISVFVFHDNQRLNGVPDLPQEEGLAGFHGQHP